jgi:hypothetical protein
MRSFNRKLVDYLNARENASTRKIHDAGFNGVLKITAST